MASIYDRALDNIASAAQSLRLIPNAGSDRRIGTQAECPRCKELIEWRQMGTPPNTIRYWSDCSCWLAECDRAASRNAGAQDHAADYRADPIVCDIRAYQSFTFGTFDSTRLVNGDKLVAAARRWLEQISDLSFADRGYADPRCCLYFYSGGKGRGKTHLASAIALAAREAGKTISIVDETGFLESYWAAGFEAKQQLTAAPSEKAWLTVFDDMGSREKTPDGLRDLWYDLIGPRWLKRGWTIVTSNWTLDELAARGTIDDRVYSRLYQMTGGRVITFDGIDQRLQEAL
jgi:DNA replication protein DnaC